MQAPPSLTKKTIHLHNPKAVQISGSISLVFFDHFAGFLVDVFHRQAHFAPVVDAKA